ncbi:hypothetical protein [Parasphingorhabdus sp.]|uniref:hypothetical protein n=1 Tax=Parasphingorhabdus sp. TaxID=2709688 RepID=UPI002F92CA33
MSMTQEQIDRDRKYQFEQRQAAQARSKAFYERHDQPQKKRKGTPGDIAHQMYPEDVPLD